MTAGRLSDLALAADFSGSGTFSTVGFIRQPSLALGSAIGDFRRDRGDAETRPVLIHALATRIAGLCSIESAQAVSLRECFASRLAAEWIVTFPKLGTLRALFVIARLEKAAQAGLFDFVLHLAGMPSFRDLQTEGADAH